MHASRFIAEHPPFMGGVHIWCGGGLYGFLIEIMGFSEHFRGSLIEISLWAQNIDLQSSINDVMLFNCYS